MRSISEAETKKFAQNIAKKLLQSYHKRHRGSLIIGLKGDLGAGKTFFVKSFLGAFGIKERVVSPTFVLMREYEIKNSNAINKKYKKAYHIDAYRLHSLKDLRHLNFNKLLKEKNAILLIEWADKIKKLLPKKTLWMDFKHGKKENERIIKLITNNQ